MITSPAPSDTLQASLWDVARGSVAVDGSAWSHRIHFFHSSATEPLARRRRAAREAWCASGSDVCGYGTG